MLYSRKNFLIWQSERIYFLNFKRQENNNRTGNEFVKTKAV